MKLLYITNGINGAGGLERVLSIKASFLTDILDYEVHIIVLNQKETPLFYEFSSKISIHNVVVYGNPVKYLQKYTSGIVSVITSLNPDVISVCDDGLKGFFIPKLLPKKIPIVYERHVSKIIELGENPSFFKKTIVYFKFLAMNRLAKNFDRFVVLTIDNIQEWKLKNLLVISNPLTFYPATSASLTNKKVIAVGKQGFQKGHDRLLDSWRIVQNAHPDWELYIYGAFEENKRLLIQAKQLHIENSVHFFEPVKNIEAMLLASSVFAFSSRFEGFGMVLIEAMACGVPCVSFDCPCGPSSIIKNDDDGFLVSNGDIDTFAEKLLELIQNDEKRKLMGRAAKENVQRYLPETIMPLWDELFKELTT